MSDPEPVRWFTLNRWLELNAGLWTFSLFVFLLVLWVESTSNPSGLVAVATNVYHERAFEIGFEAVGAAVGAYLTLRTALAVYRPRMAVLFTAGTLGLLGGVALAWLAFGPHLSAALAP